MLYWFYEFQTLLTLPWNLCTGSSCNGFSRLSSCMQAWCTSDGVWSSGNLFCGVNNHTFPVWQSDGRFEFCWTAVECYLHDCIVPTVKFGITGISFFFFFSGVGLGSLLPVKVNLNASPYQDILNNAMLATLQKQCGKGPFLFQQDSAQVQKARSMKTCLDEFGAKELDWPAQSHDLNPTFGMNWNEDCEPGVLVQHQCLISQVLY